MPPISIACCSAFTGTLPFRRSRGDVLRLRARSLPAGATAAAPSEGLRPLLPILAIGAVIAGDAILLTTSALPAWFARSAPPPAEPRAARGSRHRRAVRVEHPLPGSGRRFGRTSQALIGAANPVGIDRDDPAARDDIGLLNVLTLPLGRPVIVHLSSRDVIHSFTLNEMRVRQDVTPGIATRTWFTPIVAGRWDIACSQLCGLGHYRMRGEYAVLPQAEWDQWLAAEVKLLGR